MSRVLIHLDRSDWPTATHLLETLKPTNSPSTPPLDPELSFLQHDTYINYLISTAQFPLAYQYISALAQSLKEDNADIQQRISVLLMQADLWIKVGKPERGFSVALRAASISFRVRLGFTLWYAVGCLGAILNSLGEYREAKRLVEGVLPQVRIYIPLSPWQRGRQMMLISCEIDSRRRRQNAHRNFVLALIRFLHGSC